MKATVCAELVLVLLALLTPASFPKDPSHAPEHESASSDAPTFNRSIAPIIFTNCAVCHHPGGSAPFSLLTYADVKKRARQIAQVTSSRYMPPWLPEPGYARFVGERRLNDVQIQTIQQWVAAGANEGSAADLPPQPTFPVGWQLGKPDLIVQVPQPYILLPQSHTESWPRFVLPIPPVGTHYVRGVEINPGTPGVVHHCYIETDRSDTLHITNGRVYESGSIGMENKFEGAGSEPDSRFLTWRPGTPPFLEPEGATWRLDKDTNLTLTLHLLPSGKSELIQPTVAFYFSDKPPTQFPMILHLEHDGDIDIPPGTNDYVVSDDLTLPVDVKVLSVLPHAHYLCRDMKAFATLPDGTRKWLIWIKRWDFDWQGVFRYAEPLSLPKGTILSMRYTYDNSAGNPRNPNNPPRRVLGGPRSTDEMADLWLQVLPDRKEDLYSLEISLMQRKLVKYPQDPAGYADLGAALRAMGRNQEAIGPLSQAARLNPEDVQVQNNLGTVLGSLGQMAEAIDHFREALRGRPDYFVACMNLASALRLSGNLTEALSYYREAVRLKPDSAEAHKKLGLVDAQTGDLADAVAHFEAAIRLQPADSAARENLARAQQALRSALK